MTYQELDLKQAGSRGLRTKKLENLLRLAVFNGVPTPTKKHRTSGFRMNRIICNRMWARKRRREAAARWSLPGSECNQGVDFSYKSDWADQPQR